MLPEIAPEQYAKTLDGVADELLRDAGLDRAPIDALRLAAAMDIVVAVDARQAGRARFVRLRGQARARTRDSILIRPEPRPERRQWAVAHEIGERVAARVFDRLGIEALDAPPAARESVANELAGRLLLPSTLLRREAAACDWDLVELKRVFATASHELIARRMLDFATPVVVTVIDQERTSWRRSNVPGRVPSRTDRENAVWNEARLRGLPTEHAHGLQRWRCWPMHEDDWRREILRWDLPMTS